MSTHPNYHYNAIYGSLDEYFHFRRRAVIVVWMSTLRNYYNPLGGNGSLDEYSSELPQSLFFFYYITVFLFIFSLFLFTFFQ